MSSPRHLTGSSDQFLLALGRLTIAEILSDILFAYEVELDSVHRDQK
jgi:hypothetical protein